MIINLKLLILFIDNSFNCDAEYPNQMLIGLLGILKFINFIINLYCRYIILTKQCLRHRLTNKLMKK